MKNLKEIRTKLGFSQQQIAEAVHLSRGHYCNIENGKRDPSMEVAADIATFLGVSIEQLRGDKPETDNEELARLTIMFNELNATGKELALDYLSMLITKSAYREKELSESAM